MAALCAGKSGISTNIFRNFKPCLVVQCDGFNKRHSSSSSPNMRRPSALKRGTGGRSSFNGVVATIFGANGFIGTNVLNKLGKIGTQIIIPYRGDHYEIMRLKLVGDLGQVLYFPFELRDEDSIRKAMQYSNVVINLIGRDHETSNYKFEDVHVTGARNIARIAREMGVRKFIHVSALNAKEKPTPLILKNGSQFLASKWRGEQAVMEEFPEAIIFRPADLFGHLDRFLNYYGKYWRQIACTLPMYNRGEGIFKQPLSGSDFAQAIVNSIFTDEFDGETIEAVGPNRYELSELVDWFFRIMWKTKQDWGYRRTHIKYSPVFQLKASLLPYIFRKYPPVSWERLEREHVSDERTIPLLPSIKNLGVKELTTLEDYAPFQLKLHRAHGYYKEDFGEFDTPLPPKTANLAY